MFSKFFQRLRHQACAVLFGIVLISACTVSAGAVVLQESGDGMSLYGDSVLPDISTSGVPSDFSYHAVGMVDGVYHLIVTRYPLYVTNNGYVYYSFGTSSVGDVIGYDFALVDSSWYQVSRIKVQSNGLVMLAPLPLLSHLWSDYDILYSDLTVALESSSSFSLTGYSYIYWDGDTSGLPSYSFSYRVSDLVLSESMYNSSYEVLCNLSDDSYYDFLSCSPVIIYNPGIMHSSGLTHIDYDDPLSPDGLYFSRALNSNYTKYFIYPSDSNTSIDFSSTSLTASNPQYDYQSAEFDVSWSNLPQIPYPDNVQYFIQGRLNDGSAAQPPEIYLGSSSDPPTSDVPVSFSFTGLQPETQYTATFELVYNTTGSFRDFIRSGVTSTVSFTTLSDGSISEGDKAIINAIQSANKDNQQWTDSQFGSAVGDLPEDTSETDNLISGLDQQEEAYKDDAYDRFQELSSAFSGFDGTVGSGIGLAGTLFSRFFNALGSYKIVYTFPLLLGLAMVLIGRLGRSSIRMEREPDDHS